MATQVSSKVYVFSDSVPCHGGKCQKHLEAARICENDRIREFVESPEYRPYCDITGKPTDVAWKIFVVKTTMEVLECINNVLVHCKACRTVR